MTDFRGVVEAWRKADPTFIHPLRNVSEEDYWESGRSQALQAAQWIPEGGTVLDFGCGDGRISLPLAKLGFRVTAVDASVEMLLRLQDQDGWREINSIVLSDGLNLSDVLFNQLFDAVVCRAVLIHHSHADGALLVRQLTNVLKPGGVLIADWPLGPHHERRDWIDVTYWEVSERQAVADANGLELINDGSVWRKQ